MRILVACKRQYTSRDLLDDRFGRLFEIPECLAARGHEVHGLTLSYRARTEGDLASRSRTGVRWTSVNAGLPFLRGVPRYLDLLGERLRTLRPDVVWAGSDVYHAIAASRACRRAGIPLVIELYDNYESFRGALLPGARTLFRKACRDAAGLTVVSRHLVEHVSKRYGAGNPKLVLGNAVRKELFRPQPKREARAALGLPDDARIIGTAGAITRARGIGVLFEAFLRLANRDPALWLVHAGPVDATPARYRHPRVRDLGVLDPARIPSLFSALDVAVVCNVDSAFGRFCFPQKFFEIVACGTPLAAASVGDVADLLRDRADCRFEPGSVAGLERCLRQQLETPRPVELHVPEWQDRAAELEHFLEGIANAGGTGARDGGRPQRAASGFPARHGA